MKPAGRTTLAGLCLGVLLVLTACSSPSDDGSPSSPEGVSEIVFTSISAPKSFNPVTAKETSTTQITSLMFVGLTTVNGVTGEVEPQLAKSWTTKKGGRVWEFTLRKGLTWSDGEPLTAEDVVFTYEDLYLNPDVYSSSRFSLMVDGKPPEVEALSPRKVRFTYPEPFAPFARQAGLGIMPEHVLRPILEAGEFNSAWGVGTDTGAFVVNGPYKLHEYRTGQRVVLRSNPNYYETGKNGEPLPRLDRVIFEIVKSREVALQRFMKGQIDELMIQGKDYPVLAPRTEELNFSLHRVGPTLGTTFLSFNMNRSTNKNGQPYVPEYKQKWFNDTNFRRAVSYGIDRQGIIDIVYNGLGVPTYGPVSPANKPFYNENLDTYPHDPERARRILRENGYRDRDGNGIREGPRGHRMEFVLYTNSGNDERVEMTEIIRQDLENLGFDVTFSQVEFNTLVSKLNSSYDWESVVIGFTGSLDPHFGSNLWLSSGDLHIWDPAQEHPIRPWEKKIDRIFQKAVTVTDRDRRRQLYDRWQQIVVEKQPVIPLVNGEAIYAVRNRFTNVKPTAIGGFRHNIEHIGVKE